MLTFHWLEGAFALLVAVLLGWVAGRIEREHADPVSDDAHGDTFGRRP